MMEAKEVEECLKAGMVREWIKACAKDIVHAIVQTSISNGKGQYSQVTEEQFRNILLFYFEKYHMPFYPEAKDSENIEDLLAFTEPLMRKYFHGWDFLTLIYFSSFSTDYVVVPLNCDLDNLIDLTNEHLVKIVSDTLRKASSKQKENCK